MLEKTGEASATASSDTRSIMGFKASQHATNALWHTSFA